MSIPQGMMRYSPGKWGLTQSRAASETAVLTVMQGISLSASGFQRR